jgi:hypothetical protein
MKFPGVSLVSQIFVQEVAYQKASEGFEVAKVAGAMAAEVPGDFWVDIFPESQDV